MEIPVIGSQSIKLYSASEILPKYHLCYRRHLHFGVSLVSTTIPRRYHLCGISDGLLFISGEKVSISSKLFMLYWGWTTFGS